MKVEGIDFRHIRTLDGKQDAAFEEFCCQIARHNKSVPNGSSFFRYRGAGGDGGVECVWQLPSGEEWGWQAKYLFALNKTQFDKSVEAALFIHPKLTRYYICIPFDLTGPTGRTNKSSKKKSEYDKYEDYVREWSALAQSQGRNVEFILYSRSRLLDELMDFDSNQGRLRFWFDVERFGDEWFESQLADVLKAAEPRYTPHLTVKVPVFEAFETFGRTTAWEQTIRNFGNEVAEVTERWRAGLNQPDLKDKDPDFPSVAREWGDLLASDLETIRGTIENILAGHTVENTLALIRNSIEAAFAHAATCLTLLTLELEAEYGSGVADSVGFRQFKAEYDISFPARHVDAARAVLATLQKLKEWIDGALSQLSATSAMLLLGPAGIGKTHSICDIAANRSARGLRSIVLLGELFGSDEPWIQISKLLGLGSSTSRDELLSALDAAGESTGFPLIIFIDALNETRPHDFWYKQLALLIEQISRFESLKLCVSCRSTYYEETIAPNVRIPQVEHTGFEGVEFDAAFEFFHFYNIEAPSLPLMQPEFSNPLFLRLLCETLRDMGINRIPDGMLGITGLIDSFLNGKNARIARMLDFHPRQNLVRQALDSLVSAMATSRTDSLSWQEAKNLADSFWPTQQRSSSLFESLFSEGLIREEARDVIRLSFERLADHLLAAEYLKSVPKEGIKSIFADGGALYFAIADIGSIRENSGLLEALAVQLPEKYGAELTDLVEATAPQGTALFRCILDSLIWRSPSSISKTTMRIVRTALGRSETFEPAMEAVIALGTRIDNPLNALWFHKLHADIPMPQRDVALCPFLHQSFGRRRGLDKLIRWALQADLLTLTDEVAELWATQLAWFCAAADRRVRDYATRAMVRVMEHHAGAWPRLLERFCQVDDEYIVERILASAYASLLRKGQDEEVREVADAIYTNFFEHDKLPKNAMIRDYARLILEFAGLRNVLATNFKMDDVRPPYTSEWPLDWPDQDFKVRYANSNQEFPKLYRSCMEDDFAIYTVTSALHGYPREEVKNPNSWIFREVLNMGYTGEGLARFDKYMLAHYGGGRSKEIWAERIGKKYQWIALYRLIAHVADNVTKGHSWDDAGSNRPSLQALGERNIDPTVLRERQALSRWEIPIRYAFDQTQHLSPEDWLNTNDFPDSADALGIRDPIHESRRWLLLSVNLNWRSRGDEKMTYPYRYVSLIVRSYLIQNRDKRKCWNWFQKQRYHDVDMPDGYRMHSGFLAEYPWALPFARYFDNREEEELRSGIPVKLTPTAHFLNIHFEFDAYQPDPINALVPAKTFFDFEQLRWDSANTYKTIYGKPRFVTLPLTGTGPTVLLVEANYLNDILANHELTLVWAVRFEKHYVDSLLNSHNLGYADCASAHLLDNGEIKHSRPLFERIRPPTGST